MTTQKQAQIEARNKKIIGAWEKELKTPSGLSKAKWAEQFSISPRQLNRILDDAGVAKNPEKQPTAAASPSNKTAAVATKKKKAAKPLSKKVSLKEKKAAPVKKEKPKKEVEAPKAEEPDTPLPDVIFWTITSDKFISCMLSDGEPISIETSHKNYSQIATLLVTGDTQEAVKLMSLKKKLQALQIRGFTITSKGISLNGHSVSNDVVADIVGVFEREEPVEHLVKFLENLMLSSNPTVYKNLYFMLKHANMSINKDGNVECFKRVDKDFKDCYTHTIDNSVGAVVTMLRSDVDANQSNTCSTGLHVCAFKYLTSSGYGGTNGAKVVKVSVRPQDFVAIPPDYEFTKARTCQYTVLADVTDATNRGDFNAV